MRAIWSRGEKLQYPWCRATREWLSFHLRKSLLSCTCPVKPFPASCCSEHDQKSLPEEWAQSDTKLISVSSTHLKLMPSLTSPHSQVFLLDWSAAPAEPAVWSSYPLCERDVCSSLEGCHGIFSYDSPTLIEVEATLKATFSETNDTGSFFLYHPLQELISSVISAKRTNTFI